MPDQFVVPQFIDAEDKIFGPITARQFVILMVALLIVAALFKLVSFIWFLALSIPLLFGAGVIAFARINGQPFHFFVLNLIQTQRKPSLRVWDKTLTDAQLRAYLKETPPEAPTTLVRKQAPSSSRLSELSLVVNTGGVYRPDQSSL